MDSQESILVITDSFQVSKAMERYIAWVFEGKHRVLAITYGQHLPGKALWEEISLLILECYRDYGPEGFRNEGVRIARKNLDSGKRTIVFSSIFNPGIIPGRLYWDFRCEPLSRRIREVLSAPLPTQREIENMLNEFRDFSTVDKTNHHHSLSTSSSNRPNQPDVRRKA